MNLFKLDIHTFIILLIAGNLASIAILPAYRSRFLQARPFRQFIAAKILQAAAWFLLGMRGDIPDLLSVYIGNTLLLAGFAFEAAAISAADGPGRRREPVLTATALSGIALFWIFASTPNIRVVIASLSTIPLFSIAAVYLLVSRERSVLRIVMGVFYSAFCLILSFRALAAYLEGKNFGLMSQNLIQTLSFMPLYVVLFVSGTGFLLISRERSDRMLAESEEKFSKSFHSSPDGILLTWLSDGGIIEMNAGFERISGYSLAEVKGKTTVSLNIFSSLNDRLDLVKILSDTGSIYNREFIFRKKSGEEKTALLSCEKIVIGGREAILSTVSDITDRKVMEKNIMRLLEEKDLLLKEVHHRIKNNLNTVIALLGLQAESTQNRESSSVLYDAGNRLLSMSMLYDRLYRSGNFMEMPARDFLAPLVHDIVKVFPAGEYVEIIERIGDFTVNADTLQPVGIIVNELVTNSMKHAFGREGGVIEISAEKHGDIVDIVYRDSGPGFHHGEMSGGRSGFGMQLVEMIVRQLNGSMSKVPGDITEYRISFSQKSHPGAS